MRAKPGAEGAIAMPFKIVRNDITKMNTEAVVNTANDRPAVGDGCDTAIYKAAGYEELLAYRKEHIGAVKEGDVFITPGFKLPAKYIIHAVSPYFVDGQHHEEELLRSCYRKSLALAAEHGIRSIAFPLISTGSYGYPKEEGMRIAVDEIHAFLLANDMQIYLVVFDEKATQMGKRLYPDLEAYIDRNYVEEKRAEEYEDVYFAASYVDEAVRPAHQEIKPGTSEKWRRSPRDFEGRASQDRESYAWHGRVEGEDSAWPYRKDRTSQEREDSIWREDEAPILGAPTFGSMDVLPSMSSPQAANMPHAHAKEAFVPYEKMDTLQEEEAQLEDLERGLAERMKHLSDSFPEYLMYLIHSKGMENAEVYKRAIIDKKVFSKIKNNADYHPQKLTALCLCIGAKLNLDESKDLLSRAGYALSPCDKTDIIFSYFIEHEIYDMIELDIQLEEHGLPCIIS